MLYIYIYIYIYTYIHIQIMKKVLLVFYDLIAYVISDKELNSVVSQLLIKR